MLILYVKSGCAFSAYVREAAADMGVKLQERNISENEEFERQLMERGGKHETPFLVDEEKGVAMYESQDIVKYLRDTYAKH